MPAVTEPPGDTAHFYGDGFVNDLLRDTIAAEDGVTIVTETSAEPDPTGPSPLRFADSLPGRADEPMHRTCTAAGVAWAPFFPLGGAFAGHPQLVDNPTVERATLDALAVA